MALENLSNNLSAFNGRRICILGFWFLFSFPQICSPHRLHWFRLNEWSWNWWGAMNEIWRPLFLAKWKCCNLDAIKICDSKKFCLRLLTKSKNKYEFGERWMNWHENMKINVVNNENGSGYERYTNNNSIHIQVFEMLFSIKEILIAVAAYFNCKHTESQNHK